jgi:Xaa-Pro aminopeptidase
MRQAVESVRPGVSAGVVASEVSKIIEASGYDNPLHIGHGIGTSFHEFPKIVVEEKARLEPGMVLMMEPGACREGVGGARLEWMFEVTETGNRILTDFEFSLA